MKSSVLKAVDEANAGEAAPQLLAEFNLELGEERAMERSVRHKQLEKRVAFGNRGGGRRRRGDEMEKEPPERRFILTGASPKPREEPVVLMSEATTEVRFDSL